MRLSSVKRTALALFLLASACTPQPTVESPSPSRTQAVVTPAATSARPAAVCAPFRPIALGAMSGRAAYPSEGLPALAIIAVRVDDPGTFRVIHTSQAVQVPAVAFTMAAVEPGTYTVHAYAEGVAPSGQGGAFTPAVACGLGVTCTDHSLIRVTVRPGETTSGIDVRDWYAPPGTFPPRPAGSEPFHAGDSVRMCNPYADSANLRASAGLSFPVRRTLDNGISLVRDGPLAADGYDWYEVNLADDQLASGWVVAYTLRR